MMSKYKRGMSARYSDVLAAISPYHFLNFVMSRFSTLSAQERKRQAAAICSEIHGTTDGWPYRTEGSKKAPRGISFKVPELELNPPSYPELQDPTAKRPTFNRTAQGWISDGVPLIIPAIPVEPLEIPESDDL
ncbi:Myozenin-2 [Bagarius yarrelli]|uniref:Myozenin-2 n=1 Tax=Bagarius yarrelli TaxID=175774 RepID=A0A556VBL4_BAGYA|nr:Myozenin-2 [Bagarius yarrelli]